MIITCFFIEDILTNRSFFFQPSGSSKSASTDSRTKRGPGKKLKEGVKYNIDSIKASGEPLTPKNIANKWTRQCGVAVKDPGGMSLLCTRDRDYWMTKSKIIFDVFIKEMAQ